MDPKLFGFSRLKWTMAGADQVVHPWGYGLSKSLLFIICLQVQRKAPGLEKTSLTRTFKDHLYQCPSKLSEELIRCMAAIYCCLQSPVSKNPEKNRSPLLSRSSTNVVLPRRSIGEDREWSSSSTVEISCISTEKTQFSRISYAISNYR